MLVHRVEILARLGTGHYKSATGDIEVFDDGGTWSLHWRRKHGDVMLAGLMDRKRLLAAVAMNHGLHLIMDVETQPTASAA